MKVISYLNVVPAKNKSQEKIDILKKFILGVNVVGDTGILHQGYDLQKCDVGIIQGWQHETGKNAPHLRLRQGVIERTHNTHVCTADSNLFLYANKTNHPHHYLRYSFNGIFPNTGRYCDDILNPRRWNQIKNDLNIDVEKNKKNGRHILIAVQRNGGWSMGKTDVGDWVENTVKNIMLYTDRPIVIRLHPGDKQSQKYTPDKIKNLKKFKNITISKFGKHLNDDLENCHAVVNHNSSSIVGSIIKGYPAFITDPITSQCREVSHTDFKFIDIPQKFDRYGWLQRISMFHWKFDELEDGTCWKHMRQYINS